MVQVLQRVGMHIHVRAREAVEVLRLMRATVPFQHTDVLMGGALLGAEQEQMGFPWTLERFPVGYTTRIRNGQTILWHPAP